MDVFIAYSSKDESRVRTIVDWLRHNGLEVWVAYELRAGLDWDSEIDRVLAEIPCVLAVWSPDAVASAEVKGEARAAMARDALVTVSLDNALPPRSFTHLHAVDLSGLEVGEDSPRTAQVLNGIHAKLAADRQSVPAVSEPAPGQSVAPPVDAGAGRETSLLWTYVGGALLAAGGIFMIVGGEGTAHASCDAPDTYRLTGQTFSKDTTIDQSVVCIADNATIRVTNGATLTVNADTLVLQGPARFDGRGIDGTAGRAGSDGPRHHHKPPVVLGISVCANAPPRSDYDGKPGGRGGNGGPGATIRIGYKELQGAADELKRDVAGGKPGAGGRGGRAGRAICKAGKPYDVKGRSGPQGSSGSPGSDGSFELVQLTR
jgi:hypothetical protein